MTCPAPSVALMTLVCALGGCTPEPKTDAPPEGTRRVPVTPVPCPTEGPMLADALGLLQDVEPPERAPVVLGDEAPVRAAPVCADDKALAKGPALRLDGDTFQSDREVLAKLQDTLAEIERLKNEATELAARLDAAKQANTALTAQVGEFQRQVAQLSAGLKTKTDALVETKAGLAAAKATIASLEPKAKQAEETAGKLAEVQKQLDESRAANATLRDQAIEAKLARVKAQQDLVALQIVMARQKALIKHRPKPTQARAPLRPNAPPEETAQ